MPPECVAQPRGCGARPTRPDRSAEAPAGVQRNPDASPLVVATVNRLALLRSAGPGWPSPTWLGSGLD